MSSDLPGVNPTTLNGMLLYYCLMTNWSGLGDSTELSRVGLSHQCVGGGSIRLIAEEVPNPATAAAT
jgi:hypothetical protein